MITKFELDSTLIVTGVIVFYITNLADSSSETGKKRKTDKCDSMMDGDLDDSADLSIDSRNKDPERLNNLKAFSRSLKKKKRYILLVRPTMNYMFVGRN